jgi:hypothetical protein
VVDEGIEQLGAGGLGAFLAVGVADVLELAVSSLSSKSYQYLPRTNTPVSPYFSSRSWMPLKIFEKVSPFLKFRWPSSEVCDRPLPPLLTPIRFLFGLAVDQLAPTESDESNWPSISPMLKLTPNAGLASVEARLTARGSLPGARTGLLMSSTLLHVLYCYGSESFQERLSAW